jgi:hypothetical protein
MSDDSQFGPKRKILMPSGADSDPSYEGGKKTMREKFAKGGFVKTKGDAGRAPIKQLGGKKK